MVLLVGAYFTYRQLRTTREGQITERYTRAIDQLGHAQLDVRLGGIYALERIARDSSADRATIGEVLTAFVRSHAPWPPRLPGQYVASAPIDQVPELQLRAPDVQASLTVLGRSGFARPEGGEGDRLDLHAGDLRHAQLRDAHLERADLRDAHLEGADLQGAHLEGAALEGAHLERALLLGAHLKRAILLRAHLEGADLRGAHLEGVNLHGARLERASLAGARLEGAALVKARLEGAILAKARLEGADLVKARLEGAILAGANLEEADLAGANLEGAILAGGEWEWTTPAGVHSRQVILSGANLKRADLRGARLEGAHLGAEQLVEVNLAGGANLEGAVTDERTSWPDAFDWRAAGVIVTGEDAEASSP